MSSNSAACSLLLELDASSWFWEPLFLEDFFCLASPNCKLLCGNWFWNVLATSFWPCTFSFNLVSDVGNCLGEKDWTLMFLKVGFVSIPLPSCASASFLCPLSDTFLSCSNCYSFILYFPYLFGGYSAMLLFAASPDSSAIFPSSLSFFELLGICSRLWNSS